MLNDTAAATVAGFASSFMAARAASDCAAMASRRKASGLTARASYARIFVVSLHAKVWAAISCDVTGAASSSSSSDVSTGCVVAPLMCAAWKARVGR